MHAPAEFQVPSRRGAALGISTSLLTLPVITRGDAAAAALLASSMRKVHRGSCVYARECIYLYQCGGSSLGEERMRLFANARVVAVCPAVVVLGTGRRCVVLVWAYRSGKRMRGIGCSGKICILQWCRLNMRLACVSIDFWMDDFFFAFGCGSSVCWVYVIENFHFSNYIIYFNSAYGRVNIL